MDRDEARNVLAEHLGPLRQRPYADLIGMMGDVQVAEVVGPSGVPYQIEIEVEWDSRRERRDILVMAAIDDGRLLGSLSPVCASFIVAPDGTIRG